MTGEMRLFLERLVFPYLVYDTARSSLFPKKMPVGFIYTMGLPERNMGYLSIDKHISLNEMISGRIFGASESLVVTDTYQFDDYSKYVTSHDEKGKAMRRKEVFPLDCEKAFEMGKRFAKKKA